MKNLPNTTIRKVQEFLASRIKPYFDRGNIVFSDSPEKFPNGDVTLDNSQKYDPFAEDYMAANDINFPIIKTDYYNTAIKTVKFNLDEVIEFDVIEFKYINIRPWYYKSFLNRTMYRTLFTDIPLKAEIEGQLSCVAKHYISVVLPEKDYKSLKKHAEANPGCSKIRIRVAGPASLSGGKSISVGGRKWLEYHTQIFVENCSYLASL